MSFEEFLNMGKFVDEDAVRDGEVANPFLAIFASLLDLFADILD